MVKFVLWINPITGSTAGKINDRESLRHEVIKINRKCYNYRVKINIYGQNRGKKSHSQA